MKKEKSERISLFKRVRNMMREESDRFLGEPFIEWRGRERITIGGAKKIGLLSQERIMVLLANEKLTICGRKLLCLSFQNETLVIGGKIDLVAYGEVDT